MQHRINRFLPLLSALLLGACASGDETTPTRTLLRTADADCANPLEVCTASEPPMCYTVCGDQEPPECTPAEICTASYPPICSSVCQEDGGDSCEGTAVTSSDGAEFFICDPPADGDAPPSAEDGSEGGE